MRSLCNDDLLCLELSTSVDAVNARASLKMIGDTLVRVRKIMIHIPKTVVLASKVTFGLPANWVILQSS